MSQVDPSILLEKLAALRTELVDRAFMLESRGRLDGADVAIELSNRIAELGAEIASEETSVPRLSATLV